jgi:hypothetical protein
MLLMTVRITTPRRHAKAAGFKIDDVIWLKKQFPCGGAFARPVVALGFRRPVELGLRAKAN